MPQLIIIGMHRSHTSLVASAFYRSGLFLGDPLIGAGEGNPHGHYESQALVDFHQECIKAHHLGSFQSLVDRNKAREYSRSAKFRADATQLLSDHFDREVFGCKDPRMPFFLEGWHQVLEDPYYLITLRSPEEVVRSLMHRQRASYSRYLRIDHIVRYFRLWQETYLAIEAFIQQHRDRCLMIHTPHDFMDASYVQRMIAAIAEWDRRFPTPSFTEVIDPPLLSETSPDCFIKTVYRCMPKVRELYEHLINDIVP